MTAPRRRKPGPPPPASEVFAACDSAPVVIDLDDVAVRRLRGILGLPPEAPADLDVTTAAGRRAFAQWAQSLTADERDRYHAALVAEQDSDAKVLRAGQVRLAEIAHERRIIEMRLLILERHQ